MTSFSAEMRRRGLRPDTRLLELREHRAEPALARRLRIPVGDPVVEFVRLRLADDVPMAVERNTVPAAYVPGLSASDLGGSWYRLLADRYGVSVIRGDAQLGPVVPDAQTSSWLGVPSTQPCLAVEVTSMDSRGRVVDLGHSLYRGDRYLVTAELRL